MTYTDIAKMMEQMHLPFAYHHFERGKAPPLPYFVFYYDGRSDFSADNHAYQKIVEVTLELYSNQKDFKSESQIESVLERNEILYDKTEEYISSEKMFEQIYEFELLLEG